MRVPLYVLSGLTIIVLVYTVNLAEFSGPIWAIIAGITVMWLLIDWAINFGKSEGAKEERRRTQIIEEIPSNAETFTIEMQDKEGEAIHFTAYAIERGKTLLSIKRTGRGTYNK